jgi:hypothetical protein
MDDFATELQQERTMADEGYFQVPRRSLDDILFKWF